MDIQFADALRNTLAGRAQAISADIDTLSAAGRADEANIQKAARNIYGICQTLLNTIHTPEAYRAQLDKLEEAWQAARTLATTHSDFSRIALEDAKLKALSEVRTAFEALVKEGVDV